MPRREYGADVVGGDRRATHERFGHVPFPSAAAGVNVTSEVHSGASSSAVAIVDVHVDVVAPALLVARGHRAGDDELGAGAARPVAHEPLPGLDHRFGAVPLEREHREVGGDRRVERAGAQAGWSTPAARQ